MRKSDEDKIKKAKSIKRWRKKNKEHVAEYKRRWNKENRESINKRSIERLNADPKKREQKREKDREYNKKNREKILEYQKEWYKKNKAHQIKKSQEWYKNNRNTRRKYIREYIKEKRNTDDKFRIDCNMSRAISLAIAKKKQGKSWNKIVGYTVEQLMSHLEKQFKPKMNWENYGPYWHVDHIVPKSWFKYDSFDSPEFKKCWALSNLQPLEAEKNYKKSNKFIG